MMLAAKKVVAASILIAYDFIQKSKNIWSVDIKKEHKKILSVIDGRYISEPLKRVAVVAIWPSENSIKFTKNLLSALCELGFWVLVVSTKKLSDEQKSILIVHCAHIIERVNIGQDFGSYKIGLEWLEEHKPQYKYADSLVLANDSMYYPQSFSVELSKFVMIKSDWKSLFENLEDRYHAQSFFLGFSNKAFNSEKFRLFWKRYKAYSSRIHAINNGEIGLSQAMKRAGFSCRALYSSTRVHRSLSKSNFSFENLIQLSPQTNHLRVDHNNILDRYVDFMMSNPGFIKDQESFLVKQWLDGFGNLYKRKNPTHCSGLICNVLFGAPLKRDVGYRGIHSISQIMKYSTAFDDDEKRFIYRDTKSKKSGLKKGRVARLLFNTGRI